MSRNDFTNGNTLHNSESFYFPVFTFSVMQNSTIFCSMSFLFALFFCAEFFNDQMLFVVK